MTATRAALILVVAAAAVGCPGRPAAMACNDDRDCTSRQRCVVGECVARGDEDVDAGAARGDGGANIDDGGASIDDGGANIDGGATVEDGGAAPDDSGAAPDDGGATLDDGGAVLDDGGAVLDDGGGPNDAGAVADDAGFCPGPRPADPCTAQTAGACFAFDSLMIRGQQSIVADRSANGNDGVTTGGQSTNGVTGLAVELDGTGTAIAVPYDETLLPTAAFTMELFVRLDAVPADGGRMGLMDMDGAYGMFVLAGGGTSCQVQEVGLTAGEMHRALGAPLVVGAWTHLACVLQDDVLQLSYDGVLVDAVERPGTLATDPGATLVVGGNSPSADVLQGALDEVRIFRAARAPDEICWDARRDD